jgi:hypothetical protein
MNSVISARIEPLPAFCVPPKLSGSLAYFVGGDQIIDGHLSRPHGKPGPADVIEARKRLSEAEHICRATSHTLIFAWCRKLVPGLPKGPPEPEDLLKLIPSIAAACSDIVWGAWTAETAAEALRTFEWWPPPAKIHALLLPYSQRLTRVRDGLVRVVSQASDMPPEPRQDQRTEEAKAHVAEIVEAFRRERSFNQPQYQPAETRDPITALTLSDEALLAQYQQVAKGDSKFASAARTRAAALAAKIKAKGRT